MRDRTEVFGGRPQRVFFSANIMPAFLTLTGSATSIIGTTELGRSGINSSFLNRIFPDAQKLHATAGDVIPNFEQVRLLDPDAIFGWAFQAETARQMGFFNFVSFQSGYPTIPTQLRQWSLLGRLTNQENRSSATLETYHKNMKAIFRTEPQDEMGRPSRVLILVAGSSQMWIAPRHHYLEERLELAGGFSLSTGARTGLFSLENIAELDPDIILIQGFFAEPTPDSLFNEPVWQMIAAVRNHRVYRIPDFPLNAAPVFDPLLVKWLGFVFHPASLNNDLRAMIWNTYSNVYHFTLNENDIDELLALSFNKHSFGYSQFETERRSP